MSDVYSGTTNYSQYVNCQTTTWASVSASQHSNVWTVMSGTTWSFEETPQEKSEKKRKEREKKLKRIFDVPKNDDNMDGTI